MTLSERDIKALGHLFSIKDQRHAELLLQRRLRRDGFLFARIAVSYPGLRKKAIRRICGLKDCRADSLRFVLERSLAERKEQCKLAKLLLRLDSRKDTAEFVRHCLAQNKAGS